MLETEQLEVDLLGKEISTNMLNTLTNAASKKGVIVVKPSAKKEKPRLKLRGDWNSLYEIKDEVQKIFYSHRMIFYLLRNWGNYLWMQAKMKI